MIELRLRQRLYILPVLTAAFCVLSFLITYGIAAALGHVELAFPYISYTGIGNPERGVFGQLLNIGALLLAVNAYLRYLTLQLLKSVKHVSVRLNKISLWLGLMSAFGISMVANFETKAMRGPHYVGAFLGFGIAIVYCWIQTVMSWKRKIYRPRLTFLYQLVVCCMMTFCAIIFIAAKIIFKQYDNHMDLKLSPGPVRRVYLVSTIFEWCLAITLMAFLLSFIPDFRGVQVLGPRVEFIDKNRLMDNTDGVELENAENQSLPTNTDVTNEHTSPTSNDCQYLRRSDPELVG